MRIDAHQHFWRLSRADYRWLTPDAPVLYRDFEPDDLAALLDEAGVGATVAVQAADTIAETEHLLELADAHQFIAAVVGWAPLDAPDGPDVLADLAGRPKLVGVRPMIQDMRDDAWMLGPDVDIALTTLEHMELRLDALVRPRHLPHLRTLVERHPDLPVTIDHAAKPPVREGTGWRGFAAWRDDLRALARSPRVCCKLSGLVTEADAAPGAADLQPFVETILEAFGPSRVMWGSDWPVCLLRGSYADWMALTEELLAHLDSAERDDVLGNAAARFYGLAEIAP
ncbi:MAG: amidohydrolase family protein [Phycisphaerales bacterium JB039]